MLCQGNPPPPSSSSHPLLRSPSSRQRHAKSVFIHSFNSLSRLALSRSSCPRHATLAEGSPRRAVSAYTSKTHLTLTCLSLSDTHLLLIHTDLSCNPAGAQFQISLKKISPEASEGCVYASVNVWRKGHATPGGFGVENPQ